MSEWRYEALSAALQSLKYRKKIILSLNENDFQDPIHRWIFASYLPSLGDSIGNQETLKTAITHDNSIIDNKEFCRSIYRTAIDMMQYDNSNFDFTVNDIVKQKSNERAVNISNTVLAAIQEGRDPEKDLSSLLKTVSSSKYNEYTIINPFKDIRGRIEEQSKSFISGDRFVLSNPVLKKLFPYGIGKGEMLGLFGPTNVGKSMIYMSLLIEAFRESGINVLMINTENNQSLNNARFDAQITKKPYSELFTGSIAEPDIVEIEKQYQLLENDNNVGHVRFAKVVPYGFNASTIELIIDEVEEELRSIHPDDERRSKLQFVVIDSPEHQLPMTKGGAYWENKAAVYQDLKNLIDRRGIALGTTIQRKKDQAETFKDSKKTEDSAMVRPRPEQVAGSSEIERIMDHMLAISPPTELDRQKGRVRVWLVKARQEGIPEFPVDAYINPTTLEITWMAYVEDGGGLSMDNVEEELSVFTPTYEIEGAVKVPRKTRSSKKVEESEE